MIRYKIFSCGLELTQRHVLPRFSSRLRSSNLSIFCSASIGELWFSESGKLFVEPSSPVMGADFEAPEVPLTWRKNNEWHATVLRNQFERKRMLLRFIRKTMHFFLPRNGIEARWKIWVVRSRFLLKLCQESYQRNKTIFRAQKSISRDPEANATSRWQYRLDWNKISTKTMGLQSLKTCLCSGKAVTRGAARIWFA